MKVVEIFTDGACSGNPGPGGWGALIKVADNTIVISGAVQLTTNNRMELLAAIKALQYAANHLQPLDKVLLTTDSKYVKNGITMWLANWKRNNWQTAAKTAVKNQDLWLDLDKITKEFKVEWHWVKGHNYHPENSIADELARTAIVKLLAKEV